MVVNSDLIVNRQDLDSHPSPGHHPAGLLAVLVLLEAFLVVKLLHLKFLDSVLIVDVGEVLKIRIVSLLKDISPFQNKQGGREIYFE